MNFIKNNKNRDGYEYISLQEATRLCSYSQEYLSLRARQGKLKSVKLGRNWVTTERWLKDYSAKVEQYNDYVNNHRLEKEEKIKERASEEIIKHPPPANLPVPRIFEPRIAWGELRPALMAALVLVLIMAGGVFGKEGLLQTYRDASQYVERVGQNVASVTDDVLVATVNYQIGLASTPDLFREYLQWLGQSYSAADKAIEQKLGQGIMALTPEGATQWVSKTYRNIAYSYSVADEFVGQKIKQGITALTPRGVTRWVGEMSRDVARGYSAADKAIEKNILGWGKALVNGYAVADDFLGQKLVGLVRTIGKPFTKAYQLVTLPWRGIVAVPPEGLEELKTRMAELEKKPVVVERVEVSKVVEPVKEITRETIQQVTKVDDAALAQVRATMAYLEGEIGKRLYAPGGVVSQTIYMTEPVSSPKIYQENGEIVLQTAGSGNVILSAATGLQLYGQQVVVESTNLLNPLIYLASKTRIGGDVTITGDMGVGSVSIGGTLSVTGATTIGGNLTITGDLALSGAVNLTASSTAAALSVTQTGSGDIFNLFDGSTEVLTVLDGGWLGVATSTPSAQLAVAGNIMGSGNLVLYGEASSTIAGPVELANLFKISGNIYPAADVTYSLGSADYRWANIYAATTTIGGTITIDTDDIRASGLLTLSSGNSENIILTPAADVGIATSSPRYKLDVWGDMAVGTSTDTNTPILYVATGEGGRVGIGTTTLSGLLTVGTTTPSLVVAPNGYVGIGTATPEEALTVVGNTRISGDIVTVSGDIMPATPRTQDIGSSAYDWYNIYAYNVYANNLYGASTTVAGTSAETFTINSDAAADATSSLRFYRGTDTPHALLTWDADFDRFNFNFPLYLSSTTGSITAVGTLNFTGAAASTWKTTAGDLTITSETGHLIATGTDVRLVASSGDISATSSNAIYFATNDTERLRIDSAGYVGIGTSTLAGLLTVGTTTPSLVVSPLSYVGIGTSTPSTNLAVAGNIMGSGNVVLYGAATSTIAGPLELASPLRTTGNIYPSADVTYSLGSADYRWANIYAATTTIGGTITIDTDDIRASGLLTLSSGNSENIILTPAADVGIATSSPRYKLDVWGDMAVGTSTDTNTPILYVATGEGGRVGIGTTTLSGLLTVGTTTPSLVVAPNGYVGIGTTTPEYKLDIVGDLRISSGDITIGANKIKTTNLAIKELDSDYLTIRDSADSAYKNLLVNGLRIVSGGFIQGGAGDDQYLVFQAVQNGVGAVELGRLQGAADPYFQAGSLTALYSGNVGIGNNTPSSKLTVNGGDLAISSAGSATTTISSGVSTFAGGLISQASSTIVGDFRVEGNATTTGNFAAGSTLYVDQSNGRVGIGTESPDNLLQIETSSGGGSIVEMLSLNNANGVDGTGSSIEFDIGGDYPYARIVGAAENWAGDLGYLAFYTRGPAPAVERMRIDSSGNVGIGTAGPTSKLTVFGGNLAVGDGSSTTTISSAGVITLGSALDANGQALTDVTGGILGHPTTDGSVTIYGRGASSGDGAIVAIRSNAVSSGSIDFYTSNTALNTSNQRLSISGSADTAAATWSNITHTGIVLSGALNTGNQWLSGDGDAEGIMIDDSGNVGIGTTTPTGVAGYVLTGSDGTVLNVYDETYSGRLALQGKSGGAKIDYVDLGGGSNDKWLSFIVDGGIGKWGSVTDDGTSWVANNILVMDMGTGNVGIGTASPLAKLDVTNNSAAITSVSGDFEIKEYESSGIAYLSAQDTLTGLNRDIALQIRTQKAGASSPTLANAIRIDRDGNVGIGTTTPEHTLTVDGDIFIQDNKIRTSGYYLYQYDAASIGMFDAITGSFSGQFRVGNVLLENGLYLGMSSNVGTIEDTNVDGAYILFKSKQTGVGGDGRVEVARMQGAADPYFKIGSLTALYSGNVGIGTTAPSAKLTIAGAGSSTDFAIGDFSAVVVDSMENTPISWLSSDGTNVTTSTETSLVKVGTQSLKITASGSSEDKTVKKTFASAQNWSSYERLGLWLYADRLATSTATTTQLLSFQMHDSGGTTNTHNITIKKEARWQYEEVVLTSTAGDKDDVDYIQFRIDFGGIGAINFYVDQVRLYDDTERTGEMFVDAAGVLVMAGRGGIELVAPNSGSGALPGVRVDGAVVELGQPLSVNVGGDVGFDYDLQFLNTGLSQITSEGPLRIAAGDSNHSENLTLTTGGSGDVIVELNASSSAFMVMHAWDASNTIPFIINSETNATTTLDKLGVLFEVISDYGSDENVVFTIDAGGSIKYDMTASSPASDVAENYYMADQNISGGDVVCLGSNALTVDKCSRSYQSTLLGVISTRPALLMADDLLNARPVALAGRVPVKISGENGPVAIGDPLTSASSTPGLAMKATAGGKILGYALESFEGSATSTGMIAAFISLQDRSGGDLTVYQNGSGQIEFRTLTASGLTTLFVIDEEGALVVGKLKADEIETKGITIFDRITGEPYCVYIAGGAMQTLLGKCSSTSTDWGSSTTTDSGDSTTTEAVCESGENRPCGFATCDFEVGTCPGICQIGVQNCEGGQWGECIGEVMPQEEMCGDMVDNDCDNEIDEGCTGGGGGEECQPQTYYLDLDGDGYGDAANSTSTCEQPTGYVADHTDCQDADSAIHPGATELCDSLDNDCDGEIDEEEVCGTPPEPQPEICDGIDNNLDGQIDEDCDCGITSCQVDLNLTGECQNPCNGTEGCGTCTPVCSCVEGFSDCDGDMGNGCEIASSTCPIL